MDAESIQKAPKNLSKNKTEKVGSSGAESGRPGGGARSVGGWGGSLLLTISKPKENNHQKPTQSINNNNVKTEK